MSRGWTKQWAAENNGGRRACLACLASYKCIEEISLRCYCEPCSYWRWDIDAKRGYNDFDRRRKTKELLNKSGGVPSGGVTHKTVFVKNKKCQSFPNPHFVVREGFPSNQ